jgi:hypothetical protein
VRPHRISLAHRCRRVPGRPVSVASVSTLAPSARVLLQSSQQPRVQRVRGASGCYADPRPQIGEMLAGAAEGFQARPTSFLDDRPARRAR